MTGQMTSFDRISDKNSVILDYLINVNLFRCALSEGFSSALALPFYHGGGMS